MDRPCPFKRVCDSYKNANAILKFTKRQAKTVSEINIATGLSSMTVRRMCEKLVKIGYLDVTQKTVSSRAKSGDVITHKAKAYMNRW